MSDERRSARDEAEGQVKVTDRRRFRPDGEPVDEGPSGAAAEASDPAGPREEHAAQSDYYTAAYGAARFDPALRANVVFTDHSLATDHVFAEVQLVTCRNVLIYFDAALQNRAVGLFRDALCHKGFLGLGLGETLRFTDHQDAFEAVNAPLRLYRKR